EPSRGKGVVSMTRGSGRRLLWVAPVLLLLAPSHEARAACSVTQGDFDGSGTQDVRIKGDSARQKIVIDDSQTSYRVRVDCNNDGDCRDAVDIETGTLAFEIETFDVQGGGQDNITYNGLVPFSGARKNLLLTLGPSPVTWFNSVQINGPVLQAGTSFAVDVLGSPGRDNVTVILPTVLDSYVTVRGDLGAGDDYLGVIPIQLTNSVVTTDVDLGPGSNYQDVVGFSIDNSTILTNSLGSPSPTQVDSVRWQSVGQLTNAGRFLTNVSLLAGDDRATALVNTPATAISDSNSSIVLKIRGGAGNDTFTLNDGNGGLATTNNGLLDVGFEGGSGNDTAIVDWSGTISGNGTTRLRIDGGDGNDLLLAGLNLDSSASTPDLGLLLSGGRGNDTIFWTVLDPSGAAAYRELGGSLALGGSDTASCTFFGNGVREALTCQSRS